MLDQERFKRGYTTTWGNFMHTEFHTRVHTHTHTHNTRTQT